MIEAGSTIRVRRRTPAAHALALLTAFSIAMLPTAAVASSVRIGISREAHRLRRFYERGSLYVSGTKQLNAR